MLAAAALAAAVQGACTASNAGVNSLITCTPGTASVSIPAGQYVLKMQVVGGGGGGGRFAVNPGHGGAGQLISGYVALPATTATIRMTVGAGGAGGVVPSNGNPGGRGAGGGNGTGLYAYDGGGSLLAVIAIAGAGGGAAGSDENNNVPGHGGEAQLDDLLFML